MLASTRLFGDCQPGRVGAWTLRFFVNDMATTEKECFEPRIRAMAAGERPEFEFYSNDDRDFEGISLESALTEWAGTRNRLIDYVRELSEEERSRVGMHTKFGELTVDGYLRVALDHDRDHLRSLERLAAEASR